MDIWVKPEVDNASKVLTVLEEIGFGELEFAESDFVKPGNVTQLGYPPLRIDLLTQPDGVDFSESFSRRLDISFYCLRGRLFKKVSYCKTLDYDR